MTDLEYSGKFVLRVPRSLHRNLCRIAKQEGVSLNHLCVALLSCSVGVLAAGSAKPAEYHPAASSAPQKCRKRAAQPKGRQPRT